MTDGAASNWRAAFGPEQKIQRVRPAESDKYLLNPHKGTTTFQRFNGDPLYFTPFDGNLKNERYPDTTISYCRWLWSVIEPKKGHYRWDIIEGALAASKVRGQTLQVRIQPYIQDMPLWYWETGAATDPDSRRGRREPDHNDPRYLEHWGDFVRAFGEKFDGHPDLESFDVAYGGPCGEMGGNCTDETAERLVDVYIESFPKTQLVSMIGTHGCKYGATKSRKFGWRGDCYGDVRRNGVGGIPEGQRWNHMFDEYPTMVWRDGVTERWKTGPVTLETCWVVGHWFNEGWDIDWLIEQGCKYHLSVFMPKSCYIPEEWAEKFREFDKRIGYRFVLRQMLLPLEAKPGGEITIDVFMDNVGVAPIYRPYKFAWRFRQGKKEKIVRSKQDIRKWLPDHNFFRETVKFPKGFKPGTVAVDCGIIDPATKKPVVKLAVEPVGDDGWHPLTYMDAV
ncbi:MAG: DUF4832 domain-containing protein [Planctomycetota bacterium]|jgi:hypothetical protein